ncbi:hypothetical protein R3W88_024915 [Solanum pinnatisectum]|uniref:Uncharacterized protein n=1 Tax=Solanum pinnatisectum TaxID=50273 RepID=A0AAV9M3E6_9SOLN|nr:hypothetical protein R3W88_024915 [Solanum pinnatisectum]
MNISILLRYSGLWESDVRYERYKSDGMVVGENISFVNLISVIAAELAIDELKKKTSRSDTLLKKHEVGFGMYPLCIDTSDKSDEEIQNFDATRGEFRIFRTWVHQEKCIK